MGRTFLLFEAHDDIPRPEEASYGLLCHVRPRTHHRRPCLQPDTNMSSIPRRLFIGASMLVRGLTTRKKLVRSLKSSSIIFIVSFFSSRFFLSDIAFVLHHMTVRHRTQHGSTRSDWRQELARARGVTQSEQ